MTISSDQPLSTAQVHRHMVAGSGLMIAMRWIMRGIGVISTIVLARLLVPADFGIVAMAMIVVGFVEVFAETGLNLVLIRAKETGRDLYDTAWTLSILQGIVLALVIVAAAPVAPLYFDEPRVEEVLYVLALRPLLNGFENIGVVGFLKNLNFAKDFKLGIYKKLSSFLITVILAVVLQNYWALVLGIVAGGSAQVVLTYVMHPYRPRLCLSAVGRIWRFSAHLFLQNLAGFLNRKADEIVIGGQFGTKTMGLYTVAADVGTSTTRELTLPASRALFPIYAKLSARPDEMSAAFLNALASVAALACSSGVGMALIADPFVRVLLGEQWLAAVPLVTWLALAAAAAAIANTCMTALNASGRERVALRLTWLRTLVLIGAMIPAAVWTGIEGVAATRTAVMIVFVPYSLWAVSRAFTLSAWTPFRAIWRAAAAAAIMALCVNAVGVDDIYLNLIAKVSVGATTFVVAQALLWWACGRPDGFERMMITVLKGYRRTALQPQADGLR